MGGIFHFIIKKLKVFEESRETFFKKFLLPHSAECGILCLFNIRLLIFHYKQKA